MLGFIYLIKKFKIHGLWFIIRFPYTLSFCMFKVTSLPLSSSVSGDDLGSGSSACSSSLRLPGEGPRYFPLPLQCPPLLRAQVCCWCISSVTPLVVRGTSVFCLATCWYSSQKVVYLLLRTQLPWLLRFWRRKDSVSLSVLTFHQGPEMWKGIVIRSDIIYQWLLNPHRRALALSTRPPGVIWPGRESPEFTLWRHLSRRQV